MNSFETLLESIKERLPDFLALNKLDISTGKISCLNPNHKDSNPSMSLFHKSGNKILHCFACGAAYNIFHVSNLLCDTPIRGTGFITITIPNLCNKLGVPYSEDDLKLSSEEMAIREYRELYENVALTINEVSDYTHTAERGWSNETCKSLNVGVVKWNEFKDRLISKGKYDLEYLLSHDIDSSKFDEHSIVYTIRDKYGRVSGFSARRINWTKGDVDTKFKNTSGKVPIYTKGNTLYGYHIAKDYPQERVDIFEGYGDFITAYQAGHKSCVAICGTSFNNDHIELLRAAGFTHLNMVLDSDPVGIEKMRKYLFEYSGNLDVRLTVMTMPFEDSQPMDQRDPDDFIRLYGIKDYLSIKPQSMFDWRFNELKKEDKDPRELVRILIPAIIAEPSPIEQGHMCSELADFTKISEEDIRSEVKLRSNKMVKDIAETAISKLRTAKDSLEILSILDRTHNKVKEATAKKDLSVLHATEPLKHFEKWFNDSQFTHEISNTWKTGWKIFDNPMVLGGIKKKESILLLPGSPNHGKSSLLINIVRQILNPSNDNKNLSILFWSLDDPRNVTWNKIMSSICKVSVLDAGNPNRKIYKDPVLATRYKDSYDFIKSQVASQRLIVKGHEIGKNLEGLETWIKHVQDTTGNNVLLCIDAINDMKTGDPNIDSNERVKYIELYNWMQSQTEKLQFSLATVCHVTKQGISKGMPTIDDIAESGKAIYACKIIGMVYSGLDDRSKPKDKCDMYWEDNEDTEAMDNRKPIVLLDIQKNKETAFKGELYFKHKPECAWMEEMPKEDVKNLKALNAAVIRKNNEDIIIETQGNLDFDNFD